MRVLLLHTNRDRAPQLVAPFGLCLVASSLVAAGHETFLLDLCFVRRPDRVLAQTLQEWRPEAIGIAVRNLDNGEMLRPRSALPEIARYLRVCRRYSSAPLIIGGAAVNVAPKETLRALGADYAVVGDGEEAMPALLARLELRRPVDDLPCVYAPGVGDGPIVPARVDDLELLAHHDPGRWIDVARYLRGGAVIPIQSKRGCAFDCSYCTYPLLEGREYRLRPPESVADEIAEAIRRWGAHSFEFVDSTFNHPLAHALALCEELARRRFPAAFHTMGLNPSAVSPELFPQMRAAGFRSAICAPESASDTMLASLHKGFTVAEVEQTAAYAREAGLPLFWTFLFGGPGETEDTVRETLHFLETRLGPDDRAMCTVGLRVYPGTDLERTARAEGQLADDADLAQPTFYLSPQLSLARLLHLINTSPARRRLVYLETLQRPSVALALRLWGKLRPNHLPWHTIPLYNRAMSLLGLRNPRIK